VIRIQAAVLATEEVYEYAEARESAKIAAVTRLYKSIDQDGLHKLPEPVEYEWIHSRDFTLAHEETATAIYGGSNYPRPVWMLVAWAKAVAK
jgi:hypothetical protein